MTKANFQKKLSTDLETPKTMASHLKLVETFDIVEEIRAGR